MKVKGITFHDTGNDLSADQLHAVLIEEHKPNLCHFLVDENEIRQTWPLDEPASHTGKGYDFGNLHTIAIEVCRSTSDEETYLQALNNAVTLAKELMERYELPTRRIYLHRDFDVNTNCPHRLLEIYKTKANFVEENFNDGN